MLVHALIVMGTSLTPATGTPNESSKISNDGSDVVARWQAEQDQTSQDQRAQQAAQPYSSSDPNDSATPPSNAGTTLLPDSVRTTQYGWAGDNPNDYNTNTLKIGNRDNPLTPHVAALSDAERQKLNAQPGDVIEVGGQRYYYGDRAPESDARVDLYSPEGFDKTKPDYQQIRDLGGGSPTLSGPALSQQGEANVAQGLTANPTAPTPQIAPPAPNAGWMGGPQAQAGYLQLLANLNRSIGRG